MKIKARGGRRKHLVWLNCWNGNLKKCLRTMNNKEEKIM